MRTCLLPMRSSFPGAKMCADKKKHAGNPLWIRKGFAAVCVHFGPENRVGGCQPGGTHKSKGDDYHVHFRWRRRHCFDRRDA